MEGKKAAWDIFVERFSKLIYWSIHKTLEASSFRERKELTQEIFQEVFKRLLEKEELSRLQNVDGLKKFLTVMACHAAMDKIKSLSRRENRYLSGTGFGEGAHWQLGSDSNPANEIASREQQALIAQVFNELPAKERFCMEWCLEGKTHREISDILGIPQDTVSSLIRRTKDKLKKIFIEKNIL